MNEEEAFFLLCTICEDILPDYYSHGLQLMGSIVDQQIFASLVQQYFPDLEKHLESVYNYYIEFEIFSLALQLI